LNGLLLFLIAQLDTSIQSVEEAQKLLGLKVLAGIPRHRTKSQDAQRVVTAVALAAVGVLYAVGVGAILFWDQVSRAMRGGH